MAGRVRPVLPQSRSHHHRQCGAGAPADLRLIGGAVASLRATAGAIARSARRRRYKRAGMSIDFKRSAAIVARELIGATLLINGVGGVIVETEAYDEAEPASHSFPGPTKRNSVLFGPPGRAYIYLSYGIHWCLNISCREVGHGAGVLIRALEPVRGIPEMMRRRHQTDIRKLCAGPGQLGQALAVTSALNGKGGDSSPFMW